MATFTTRLGTYLQSFETVAEAKPYDVISRQKGKLFDFPLAWYNQAADDDTYDNFQTMFCLTHFMDEIGFETIGQFKLQLCARLTELMPYYSQLYQKTVAINYDPLINHDFTSTTTSEGNSSGQNNLLNRDTQAIHSDTPQINFDGNDFASALDRTKETALNTNSGKYDDTTSKIDHGFIGDKNDAIAKYRENIININRDILRKCDDLFMGIYNVPDFNFTAQNQLGWRTMYNGFINRI